MKLPITIEYNSGEQATYIAQPPEWAKWEKQTGNTIGQASESWVFGILCFLLIMHISVNLQEISPSNQWIFGWKQ